MPPKRRRRYHGLYFHSSPPKVLQMNGIKREDGGSHKEVFVVKPSNIRIWIHDKDVGKLTRVLWAGQGNRLRSEASTNPKVRRFLESVPHVMNVIKDVHQSVVDNNLEVLQSKIEWPVPPSLVTTKDINGLTVMHKAAGLAHTTIVEYLLTIWPDSVMEIDSMGKTPLHWAASAKNNIRCYNILLLAGADEEALDYKMKNPAYYKQKPHDIDRSLLSVVPDAPRVPHEGQPDWSALVDDIGPLRKQSSEGHEEIRRESDGLGNGINLLTTRSKANSIDDTSEPEDMDDGKKSIIDDKKEESIENDEDDDDQPELNQVTEDENPNKNDIEMNGNRSPSPEIDDNNAEKSGEHDLSANEDTEQNEDTQQIDDETLDKENDIKNMIENDETENNDGRTTDSINEDQNKDKNEDSIDKNEDNNDKNEDNNDKNVNDTNQDDRNIDKNEKDMDDKNEDIKNEIDRNEDNNNDGDRNINDKSDNESDEDDRNMNNKNEDSENDEKRSLNEFETDENKMLDSDSIDNLEINDNEKKIINNDNNVVVEKNIKNDIIKHDNDSSRPETATEDNRNGKMSTEEEEIMMDNNNKVIEENGNIKIDANTNDTNDLNNNNQHEKNNIINGIKKDSVDGEGDGDDDDDDDQENLDENYNSIKNGNLKADVSPSPAMEIEGIVHGEPDDNQVQSQSGGYVVDENSNVQNIIDSGDMEQLAALVLNGEGHKLVGAKSTQPEIQAFLDNVTAYMDKIHRVHQAARDGDLRELQAALDRRKFAIAKDEISPNGASPLHVATIFGHAGIVRYLAGRFPETTSIIDDNGRTALHYAATINDNGHFYNLLTNLGSNPNAVDKLGNTAQFYKGEESRNILSHRELLKTFGADENLEEEMLNDQGRITDRNSNHTLEIPLFKTEQGRYLASTLGDPLIKGLTEIAEKRPPDPVVYLAQFLLNFSKKKSQEITSNKQQHQQQQQQQPSQSITQNNLNPFEPTKSDQLDDFPSSPEMDDDDIDTIQIDERDEHGQSMLHFACARAHGRNALLNLIEESEVSISYRDELYRTARDVSLQASQPDNAKEIDRYVLTLAARGDIKTFENLVIQGYDHILDITDEQMHACNEIARSRGHNDLAQFLESVHEFEEMREELHQAVRKLDLVKVHQIIITKDGVRLIKAKNYYGRNALHIAVLKESEEIVDFLTKECKSALRIGDNLERTPLHYAMGINSVEKISRILTKKGAKRTTKDLKGRQPSYYFMNKADILRLQEEEEEDH